MLKNWEQWQKYLKSRTLSQLGAISSPSVSRLEFLFWRLWYSPNNINSVSCVFTGSNAEWVKNRHDHTLMPKTPWIMSLKQPLKHIHCWSILFAIQNLDYGTAHYAACVLNTHLALTSRQWAFNMPKTGLFFPKYGIRDFFLPVEDGARIPYDCPSWNLHSKRSEDLPLCPDF